MSSTAGLAAANENTLLYEGVEKPNCRGPGDAQQSLNCPIRGLASLLYGPDDPKLRLGQSQSLKAVFAESILREHDQESTCLLSEIRLRKALFAAEATHSANSRAPAFDQSGKEERLGQERVAGARAVRFPKQLRERHTRRQLTRAPDPDGIVFNPHLNVPGCRVVSMNQCVDDRLAKGIERILPNVVALKAFDRRSGGADLLSDLQIAAEEPRSGGREPAGS